MFTQVFQHTLLVGIATHADSCRFAAIGNNVLYVQCELLRLTAFQVLHQFTQFIASPFEQVHGGILKESSLLHGLYHFQMLSNDWNRSLFL